jgi:aryl-alcohol dehydrogenase-like predicted oxidoreductase
MRYIKLGHTGLDVSPIAIGAMTYGETITICSPVMRSARCCRFVSA